MKKNFPKRKRINPISEKQKIKNKEKKNIFQEDIAFYSNIWDEREHYCYETNKYLGSEPLITMFHHILPKSKYPEFRHSKWNIVLLHPDVHNQVETFIDKTPKVKELTEKTKEYVSNNFEGKAPVFS